MANAEFYQLTEAYDLAFSDRDFDVECKFYDWCYNTHGSPIPSSRQPSMIELACGPANHCRVYARNGWKTAGLDLSGDMLEYAAMKDAQAGVATAYYEQNMVDFSINEIYDFAVTPLESISHILTNTDLITHLRTVARHLHTGGIYIIESTHPRFFFPDEEENTWKVTRGNQEIELLFGTPDDEYNHVAQVWDVTTGIKISENGTVVHHVETISKHRWFLYQELQMLIQLANCFREAHFYGSYTIPPVFLDDSEQSDALIMVLKK
ncbi:MAG: class I SAM-dependent methyltransferase [Ignavibacteriales bacterium]|nr:class I SAM-dependent methyltransferase [Ignavibacteriales bacterium]